MRDQITITKEEFTDLCGIAFKALTTAGKLSIDDQDKYVGICSTLMYMFTDEYQERSRKKHES